MNIKFKKAAKAVIAELNDREGFDWWWHDIKARDKVEIIKEIAAVIEKQTKEIL